MSVEGHTYQHNVVGAPGTDGDPCEDSPRDEHAPSRSTGTLGKALEVLDMIALSEQPLRFTDILRQTDQPRGTLHRQIKNLLEEGLICQNADQSYIPGLRLLKLAARAWSQNSFRLIAESHVRSLHAATGETVHLGVMNDLEVIYVDKLETRQSVRMHSQVGNASPLYCTGIGKAMMALLPREECVARARRISYKRHTAATLYTPELLLGEIEIIRETGIAHDREEHEPGIRCVAAGINNTDIDLIGGVSVTAPAYRIDDKTVENWQHLVREAAAAIELDMRSGLGPRSHE